MERQYTLKSTTENRNLRTLPRHTMMLLLSGLDDYLLARVGLQSGLFASFIPAHQVVEKYLKAFIIISSAGRYSDIPALKRALKTRAIPKISGLPETHNLAALYAWAQEVRGCTSAAPPILGTLNDRYIGRYPDNERGGPQSASTAMLAQLDALIHDIWTWFEPLNPHLYLTHGISMPTHLAILNPASPFNYQYAILSKGNEAHAMALSTLAPKIEALFEPIVAPT
ncbi:HEPN domain-containing protein [Agrobacterium pusense]|uniref:HEPN domain-containing protein n=1 Tax=Agrobacterium pusense TaxID=648995 RepID=UPI001160E044|nr:HEPN domain-containing protein [Agrobacterium pusense]